jgi:hypothetical protein
MRRIGISKPRGNSGRTTYWKEGTWVQKGTHVDTSFRYNWNQPDPGPGAIQPRRPYPTLSRIRMQSYGSNTIYHSLQARFEHRLSDQLNLTAAYTYCHLIDDFANTTNDGGCQYQNPRNITAERASSLFDQRHLFVLGYVWNIAFAKDWKGLRGVLASRWSFRGIVTLASGSPFDVLESFGSQNNDGIYERPTLTGRNSPRNPAGKHTFDLSLGKSFKMPYLEGHSLQFRAELFNAFNTPQFANPDANLGDGSFGQITNTSLPNREVQFALKYVFEMECPTFVEEGRSAAVCATTPFLLMTSSRGDARPYFVNRASPPS